MLDMAQKHLLPAMSKHSRLLCETIAAKKATLPNLPCPYEEDTASRLCALVNTAFLQTSKLEAVLAEANQIGDSAKAALFYKDSVLPCMAQLRSAIDEAETITAKEYWPYPSYGDMLFSIT